MKRGKSKAPNREIFGANGVTNSFCRCSHHCLVCPTN